jgi:hypothetical protein
MSDLFYGAVVGFTAAMLLCATVDSVSRRFAAGASVSVACAPVVLQPGDVLLLRTDLLLTDEERNRMEAAIERTGIKAVIFGRALDVAGLVRHKA